MVSDVSAASGLVVTYVKCSSMHAPPTPVRTVLSAQTLEMVSSHVPVYPAILVTYVKKRSLNVLAIPVRMVQLVWI